MPFMEEDSTDSDGSSNCSGLSPQSTTTDATAVSIYQEVQGCHKRKRVPVEPLPRKKSRTEPYFDGIACQMDTILRTTTSGNLPKHEKAVPVGQLAKWEAHKCGSLPPSTWKSIFAYLPPRSLGTLLSVNSVFYRILTGSPKPGIDHVSRQDAHKDSERIWTLARQRHHSHFPRPLHGYRELDMWKLVGSVKCHFCARGLGPPSQSSDCDINNHLTFQVLPQTEIYWPLAVRSCHQCIGNHFLTESELGLLGRSYLIPAMNYALVKHPSIPPIPAPGSKIFLRSHMEWLHSETEKIAHDSSSPGMAESWLKTYEMNARKRQRDSIRWERWEATNSRAKLFPNLRVRSTPSSPASTHRSSPTPLSRRFMSDRQPSPATSDLSIMSKNKNRRSKNRAQNKAAATGANAVSTRNQTVAMSRAAFNHQTQPALPWNSACAPPAFGSPSAIASQNFAPNTVPATPISSFCRLGAVSYNHPSKRPLPSENPPTTSGASKEATGSLIDAIKSITHPVKATAQTGAAVSALAVQPAASFLQPAQKQQSASTLQPLPGAQPFAAAAPSAQQVQSITPTSGAIHATSEAHLAPAAQPIPPVANLVSKATIKDTQLAAGRDRRQLSIHPEEVVKIEFDGPELSRPTRSTHQSPSVQSPGRDEREISYREVATSRIRYLPETHYRTRSRSPPRERSCLYRERDYVGARHTSTYDHLALPHAVRPVPQVLYDEYGNEYVRTGRRPNPYVLYEPPPPRGF